MAKQKVKSRKTARRSPAHRDPVDEHAATELVMYIENTSDLSPDGPNGQGRSVLLNALRKWKKGTYDSTQAVRLFEYLTEAGAKRYAKEFDSEKNWSTMFTPATRHEAAKQLEASFRSSAESGEYDHIDTRIGGPREVDEHVDARGKTRLDKLRADLPPGYAVYTYSPGDGVTRYRFFENAKPSQDYFGPDNGIYTALGYAEAEAFASGLANQYDPRGASYRRANETRSMAAPRMDSFTRQYIETALWSSTDESNDQGGDPLDDNYSVSDIAPETLTKMIADCADFQEQYSDLLTAAENIDSGRAGHNFWLSRNGHGAGFFDDDLDELQEAAKSYGEFDLYVGDDGQIHGTPLETPRRRNR